MNPFPLGMVIGHARVVDGHVASPGCCESRWAEYSYRRADGGTETTVVHLVLADPVRYQSPVYAQGRLGLWRPGTQTMRMLGLDRRRDWRAITVRQPWASAIVDGHKDVENRGGHFARGFRSLLLIHAALEWSHRGTMDDRMLEVYEARTLRGGAQYALSRRR